MAFNDGVHLLICLLFLSRGTDAATDAAFAGHERTYEPGEDVRFQVSKDKWENAVITDVLGDGNYNICVIPGDLSKTELTMLVTGKTSGWDEPLKKMTREKVSPENLEIVDGHKPITVYNIWLKRDSIDKTHEADRELFANYIQDHIFEYTTRRTLFKLRYEIAMLKGKAGEEDLLRRREAGFKTFRQKVHITYTKKMDLPETLLPDSLPGDDGKILAGNDMRLYETPWTESLDKTTYVGATMKIMNINALAHGLGGVSTGTATLYDSDAPNPCDRTGVSSAEYNKLYKISPHLVNFLYGITYHSEPDPSNTKRRIGTGVPKNADGTFVGGGRGPKPFPLRLLRLVEMILRKDPTILTIEELDTHDEIHAVLSKFGYSSIFHAKSDPSYLAAGFSGRIREGVQADGVAIFYKHDVLERDGHEAQYDGDKIVPDKEELNFYDKDDQYKVTTGSGFIDLKCKGKQVALVQRFKVVSDDNEERKLGVIAFHNKSGDWGKLNKKAEKVAKSGKGKEATDKAVKKAKDTKTAKHNGAKALAKVFADYIKNDIPVIASGDFNTDWKSPCETYKTFFQTIQKECGDKFERQVKSSHEMITGKHPDRTTQKQRKDGDQMDKRSDTMTKHVEDFQFFDTRWLVPTKVETFPADDGPLAELGLVNEKWPSDHFSLMTEFIFSKTKNTSLPKSYRLIQAQAPGASRDEFMEIEKETQYGSQVEQTGAALHRRLAAREGTCGCANEVEEYLGKHSAEL